MYTIVGDVEKIAEPHVRLTADGTCGAQRSRHPVGRATCSGTGPRRKAIGIQTVHTRDCDGGQPVQASASLRTCAPSFSFGV